MSPKKRVLALTSKTALSGPELLTLLRGETVGISAEEVPDQNVETDNSSTEHTIQCPDDQAATQQIKDKLQGKNEMSGFPIRRFAVTTNSRTAIRLL